jgi:sec-independent protein translocase protein TatA
MAGIGFPELIVVAVIALFLFGPKRLPEMGKSLGEAIRGFRSGVDGRDKGAEAPKPLAAPRGCVACGAGLQPGATFCAQCGHAAAETSAAKAA